MKIARYSVVAAGLLGVLSAASLRAAPSPWYLNGGAGASFLQDTDVKSLRSELVSVKGLEAEWNTGARVELALGYRFNQSWALELETGFLWNSIDRFRIGSGFNRTVLADARIPTIAQRITDNILTYGMTWEDYKQRFENDPNDPPLWEEIEDRIPPGTTGPDFAAQARSAVEDAVNRIDLNYYRVPVMLNLIYTLPTTRCPVRPFLGVGAGGIIGILDQEFPRPAGARAPRNDSDVDFSFGYQALAGAQYELSPSASIGVIYKFLGSFDQSFRMGDIAMELDSPLTHSLLAMFILNF